MKLEAKHLALKLFKIGSRNIFFGGALTQKGVSKNHSAQSRFCAEKHSFAGERNVRAVSYSRFPKAALFYAS